MSAAGGDGRVSERDGQRSGLTAGFAVAERGVEVELQVAPGEVLALLGPNGAGKSTVLEVLAGLLRPSRGSGRLHGRELFGRQWVPPHARRVGMLAQRPALFPHLTALGNAAFAPRLAHPRAEAERVGRHWLEQVGVAELAGRHPHELSGGQAQRVALARALAADPALLLLDEPLAALDVDAAAALRGVLRRVLADRAAIVVTHDPLDAAVLADRAVVLVGGRIVEQGPAAAVLARPRHEFTASLAGLVLLTGTITRAGLLAEEGTLLGGVLEPGSEPGAPGIAVIDPARVDVFAERPAGGARTVMATTVDRVERRGDRVRLHAGRLSADLPPSAAAALAPEPGARLYFAVKPADVAVYPR